MLLAVSSFPLWPPANGAVLRCTRILEELGRSWEIHLVAPLSKELDNGYPECGVAEFFPVSLEGKWTYFPAQYDTRPLVDVVALTVRDSEPAAALLFSGTEFLARRIAGFPPTVADRIDCMTLTAFRSLTNEVGSSRWISRLNNLRKLLWYERSVARVPFATVTVGEEDARWLEWGLGTTNVHLVSNGVDAGPDPGPQAEGGTPVVIFTGAMDYGPNVDAVEFFSRRVWPQVVSARPEAEFHIVGKNPSPSVRDLGALRGVEVIGEVAEMLPVLAKAWVAVAPIRLGSGVRNKVLEAWAAGKPVVMTEMATNGLPEAKGFGDLIVDNPQRMARVVSRLVSDPSERERMGRLGYRFALARSWAVAGDAVDALLRQAVLS